MLSFVKVVISLLAASQLTEAVAPLVSLTEASTKTRIVTWENNIGVKDILDVETRNLIGTI